LAGLTVNRHREERPPADTLFEAMVVLPPDGNSEARPKLSPQARPAADARCRKRHLLVAAVRRPEGVWVLWHGELFGYGWRSDWWDEIVNPAELLVWCAPCNTGHTVDLSMPTRPRLLR
jgi:hypothetical protein